VESILAAYTKNSKGGGMVVTLKLHQLYHEHLDARFELENGVLTLELPQDASFRDVMELLNIPEKLVKILMVNSRPFTLDGKLKDKDHIFIFPPIAGG
jgi:molybdopterin converting factor small subunit